MNAGIVQMKDGSKALYKQGKYEEAVRKAKESVSWGIKQPGLRTEIPYWFSKLILITKRENDYRECLEILKQLHRETPFPAIEFYYYGYSALLHFRLGETEKAKQEALTAISWAEKDKNLLQNERKRKYGILKEKSGWPYNEVLKVAGK
jgi:tetratricopeptide (TPR) repeat protein